eukprot:EST45041.1 Hypothetical protein SS50377_15060 [Spironucleus salmonicida]
MAKAINLLKSIDVKDIPSLSEIYVQSHQVRGRFFIPNLTHTHGKTKKSNSTLSKVNDREQQRTQTQIVKPVIQSDPKFDVPLYDQVFEMDNMEQQNNVINEELRLLKSLQDKYKVLKNKLRTNIIELKAIRMTVDGANAQLDKMQIKIDLIESQVYIFQDEYMLELQKQENSIDVDSNVESLPQQFLTTLDQLEGKITTSTKSLTDTHQQLKRYRHKRKHENQNNNKQKQ